MPSNLTRAVLPRLEVFTLCLRDVVELIRFRAKDVRRAQNVRQVVVEPQVIVYDAVVDVVCFKKMFQRPRSLLRLRFDLVCFDFGQLDAAGAARPVAEVWQRRPSNLEHGVYGE
jgi:hypothetical protein